MGNAQHGVPDGSGEHGPGAGNRRFAPAGVAVDVAVLVVTHQNGHSIDRLLASLRTETVDQSLRVVVADNASCDDTVLRVRSQEDVVLVETGGNLGYAGGINAAMAQAGQAGAILILNPDLELRPHCIRQLRRRLEHSGAGIAVPAITTPDGSRSPSLRREPTVLRSLGDAVFGSGWQGRPGWLTDTVRGAAAYEVPHQVEWATGAALLVRRDVADRVGRWDERFFLYWEETDYFRRAREAGCTVWYEPTAEVVHAEGGSGRSPELVALTVVNAVRYAEKHAPRAAGARRAVLAAHELRRWRDPSHRIARTILLDRAAWDRLPGAERQREASASIDHVLVTRFNLPSEGAESLIRAQDGWLQDRVVLFERHTVPTVRAQSTSNFHWIIYFDTESPAWLVDRLRPLVEAGLFVPLYREAVAWPDLLQDAREVTGGTGDILITTNLDNDDAIAVDFVERLQAAARPGVREALFLSRGLVRSGAQLFLRTDRRNAFCSVAEPWAGAVTTWRDWHILLGRHMPTSMLDGAPAWLQVVHDRNVSNRVRGRRISPVRYRRLFAGQLDDLPVPSVRELAVEFAVHAPVREGREVLRGAAKAVLLGLLGKDGLRRFREALPRFSANGVQFRKR